MTEGVRGSEGPRVQARSESAPTSSFPIGGFGTTARAGALRLLADRWAVQIDAYSWRRYALMKRFAAVMVVRMQATRLQLLDMYGTPR